ncbi:MAG: hypothetical protein ACOYLG_13620 [Chitinophagaceae bacterium]
MNFIISYPWWFVLLCLLAGIIVSWLLYRNKKQAYNHQKIFWLLASLRALIFSALCFLLLAPLIRFSKNTDIKPTVVVMLDRSSSMKHGFRQTDSVQFRKDLNELVKDLSTDYLVKTYSFGNELLDELRYDYQDKQTDLSGPIETVLSTHENENLGAIVLISDGIFNKGNSPLSVQFPAKGSIYTVGIGDTTIQKDALVSRVFANKLVYLGDRFAIRSDVAVYGAKGSQVQVSIKSQNGSVIGNQTVNVNSERFTQSIETIVDAKQAGIFAYTISVSQLDGEQNTTNNSQQVFIEVLDNKESILIVGNAPHPDLYALREALTKNKNYQVTVELAATAKDNFGKYNLIILHNLPSVGFNAGSLIQQAKNAGVSLWFITGSQTAIPLFNQNQDALQITARGGMNDAQGILNKDFVFFNPGNATGLQNLPPLSIPFAEFKSGPNTQILLSQKLGSLNTSYPLWVLQSGQPQRIGVTCGEGLWRWRLYEYQQSTKHDVVDGLITKTAQFLSVKQDKRPFRTILPKTVFSENENVVVDAELYNANYELVNEPNVQLSINNEQNQKQNIEMNKAGNSYNYNFGNLSAGNYNYTATTQWNGKTYSSTGSFKVYAQNLEDLNTTADFGTLNQMAQTHGGSFVFAEALNTLKDKIRKDPEMKNLIRTEVQTDPLINWKWLFGLFMVLLGVEWFIRKRSGQY